MLVMAGKMLEDQERSCEINNLQTLDDFLKNRNTCKDSFYISAIPNICKSEPCVLGIDEAGRGPVLGPMVYGIAFCPAINSDVLEKIGCADSKQLNEEKREEIYEKICQEEIGWAVDVIAPMTISQSMLGRTKRSLNQISMDSAINLIRTVAKAGVAISDIFVDTVGPPEKYQALLKNTFPKYNITVAKKADSTFPIVSAASICAKVTRDHALKTWKFPEGFELTHKDFGSGYPSDPTTKKFLVENCDPVFGLPQLVRFSWSTTEELLKREAYHVEWDVEEANKTEAEMKTPSITSFFKMTPKKQVSKRLNKFFVERNLSRTSHI